MIDANQPLADALGWAIDQGITVEGRLSEAQLAALYGVFGKGETWRPELEEPLMAFAQAYSRLSAREGLALLTWGDAAAAINATLLRHFEARGLPGASWTFQSTPSSAALEILGFAETSHGIARVEAENRRGWQEHARMSRSLVLRVAEQLPGPTAAVIGAGQAFDLPLRELAERHDRLVLVDVDGAALHTNVERVFGNSELPRHIELVTCDVTGLAQDCPAKVRDVLAAHASADAACVGLAELLASFRYREAPRLIATFSGPSARATSTVDTVYSCMILSQLATPFTAHVEAQLQARFGDAPATHAPVFRRALASFTRSVQQAHVEALLATAPIIVLTSEVSERATMEGPLGVSVDISREVPLVAVERLDELLPALRARPVAITEWQWPRLLPKRAHVGSTMRVQGLVARSSR